MFIHNVKLNTSVNSVVVVCILRNNNQTLAGYINVVHIYNSKKLLTSIYSEFPA